MESLAFGKYAASCCLLGRALRLVIRCLAIVLQVFVVSLQQCHATEHFVVKPPRVYLQNGTASAHLTYALHSAEGVQKLDAGEVEVSVHHGPANIIDIHGPTIIAKSVGVVTLKVLRRATGQVAYLPVFVGSIDIAPPLLQLQTYQQARFDVRVSDPHGVMSGDRTCTKLTASDDRVAIHDGGIVTGVAPSGDTSSTVSVSTACGYGNGFGSKVKVRVLSERAAPVLHTLSGTYATLHVPAVLNDTPIYRVLSDAEAVRLLDRAYELMRDLFDGHSAAGSHQHIVTSVGYDTDYTPRHTEEYSPIELVATAAPQQSNSYTLVEGNEPRWDVLLHHLGHKFTISAVRELEDPSSRVAHTGLTEELLASLAGLYVRKMLGKAAGDHHVSDNTIRLIERQQSSARVLYGCASPLAREEYASWAIRMYGISEDLTRMYGTDSLFRMFSALTGSGQLGIRAPANDRELSAFWIALWTAATHTDLRKHFQDRGVLFSAAYFEEVEPELRLAASWRDPVPEPGAANKPQLACGPGVQTAGHSPVPQAECPNIAKGPVGAQGARKQAHSVKSAITSSEHPRLLPQDIKAALEAKRTANTPDWAAFFSYVWANRATTGNYTSSYLMPLMPILYNTMPDGAAREEIKMHGIRMMISKMDRAVKGYRVVAVTKGITTLIKLSGAHGISEGASQRCYVSFFTGSQWGAARGERTCRAVDEVTVSFSSSTFNSTNFTDWLPTGDEMVYVVSNTSEALDFGADDSRTQWWKYAYALDTWMPFLSAEQKDKCVRLHRAILEFGTVVGGTSYWINDDFRATGNLGTGRRMYVAMALAALQGEVEYITGTVTVASIWGKLIERADHVASIMNAGVLQGGSLPEGVEYSSQAMQYLARMFEAIRGATGVNYWSQVPNWPREVAMNTIHSSSPSAGGSSGLRQPVPDGDTQDSVFEQYSPYVRYAMLYVEHRLREAGNTVLASRLKAWTNRYTPPESPNATQDGWFERIQYTDESFSPAADWSGPELWYHAPGNGRLYIRSSWGSDATLMAFNAGRQLYDHLHAQAGGFHWWSKSKWATRKVISYGGAGFHNIGNNVLLAGGRGTVETGGDAEVTWHSGFSRVHVPTDQSYLYARANTGPLYPYRASMLTTDTTTYRDMVFFPSRNLLIGFDHCKFKTGTEKVCSFLIQSGVDFTTETVSANRFTLTEPDSLQKFDTDVVEPTSPIMTYKTHGAQYITSAEPSGDRTLVMLSAVNPPDRMNVSGGVGEWTALNGAWDLSSTVALGKANPVGSDSSAKLLNVNSSAFATPYAGQLLPYRTVQLTTVSNRGTRKDWPRSGFTHVTSGLKANRTNHLFVMRGRANGVSAPSQARKLSASNLVATQIDDIVIAFVPTVTPTLPMVYDYTPGLVQHKILGLAPYGAYRCDTDVFGQVTISYGSGCEANAAGVVELSTSHASAPASASTAPDSASSPAPPTTDPKTHAETVITPRSF